jgi:hypothetical protein
MPIVGEESNWRERVILLIHTRDLSKCILPLKSFIILIVEKIITQFNVIMRVN